MKTDATHIEVAIPLPVFKTYTYAVPEPLRSKISPGKRVLVPVKKQRVTGYVLGPAKPGKIRGIKNIIDIIDDASIFPENMIPFFKWISDYYIHPIGEVIKEALPGGINLNEYVTLHITESGQQAFTNAGTDNAENQVLNHIRKSPARLRDIQKKIDEKISNTLISKMERKGLITRRRELNRAGIRPKTERYARLTGTDISVEKLSNARKKIIQHMAASGDVSIKSLTKIASSASRMIRAMEKEGHVSIFEKSVYRDPFGEAVPPDSPPLLTFEQGQVVSEVKKSLGKKFTTFLLAGVTGSGKTEVYMHVAEAIIKKNRTVLVLVPEIALISEVERRFRARFGDCIAVLHSGLSGGERYDQWIRILNRESPIVIGARSAIFAPLSDIGVIIVDEEHDTSYKQESRFRYNARDMAIVRAKQEDAVALLGSATPSIQSIYNVETRKFKELNLTKRIHRQTLPDITIVDLRKQQDFKGIRRFVTSDLHRAMKEALSRGEQVLLFLNRRGFASYPVCARCGESIKCDNCDITLTLHQKANAYKCHLCGYTKHAGAKCFICDSSSIKQLGMGTEKVEEAVKALFPDARVSRMDRDTVARKGALVKILKDLRNQKTDILIGTQMIAKGHDFPKITLVGIICADLSLSFPDFRAGELTFQLLAQVAGRAGRGDRPGRVILQTYNPDHFSILSAQKQDFIKFYNQEIGFRKDLQYPPFSRMIQLKISGKDKEKTRRFAEVFGELCHKIKTRNNSFSKWIDVFGPIEAPLFRIKNRYRWQMLLKSVSAEPLHRFARELIAENNRRFSNRQVRLGIDVDPFFMM